MSFKVKLFHGAPDYETLHVAKLTCFPLETRDYKPYSQARVCFAADGLHVQLLSFEAEPLPDSQMCAVFLLDPAVPPLVLSLSADGAFSASLGGDTPLEASVHTFSGEDLQGVYWGGNVAVAGSLLVQTFGGFVPAKDIVFTGNLYKICRNPERPHYGCFYSADFSKPLTDPVNFGEFVVIDY